MAGNGQGRCTGASRMQRCRAGASRPSTRCRECPTGGDGRGRCTGVSQTHRCRAGALVQGSYGAEAWSASAARSRPPSTRCPEYPTCRVEQSSMQVKGGCIGEVQVKGGCTGAGQGHRWRVILIVCCTMQPAIQALPRNWVSKARAGQEHW